MIRQLCFAFTPYFGIRIRPLSNRHRRQAALNGVLSMVSVAHFAAFFYAGCAGVADRGSRAATATAVIFRYAGKAFGLSKPFAAVCP